MGLPGLSMCVEDNEYVYPILLTGDRVCWQVAVAHKSRLNE